MIVVARKVGQLGNRLWLFAHFIACARENSVRLANPAFDEYARYFRTTERDLFCVYPPRWLPQRPAWWARRLTYLLVYYPTRLLAHLRCAPWPFKIIRLPTKDRYDLANPDFTAALEKHKVVLAQGWGFRNPSWLLKHADAIREFFQPLPRHQRNVERVAAAARSGADLLVGVHIRQGDYAKFLGGKYFYSTRQYRKVMQRIERLFAPQAVKFLVCSDRVRTPALFPGLDVVMGSGHLVEDMYALARCDLLVGPPSTYTAWASFYGNVPLCHLQSPDMAIDRESFKAYAI